VTRTGLAHQDQAGRLRPSPSLNIRVTPLRRCLAAQDALTKTERAMQKQWTVEMHYPGNREDSLITTDRFDDFAEVERKIKQNREMVFVVKPPAAPLAGELQMLDDLRKSGLKIERP
jgi:hypothetical protein